MTVGASGAALYGGTRENAGDERRSRFALRRQFASGRRHLQLLEAIVILADEQEHARVADLAANMQEATGDAVEFAFMDQGYTGEQMDHRLITFMVQSA